MKTYFFEEDIKIWESNLRETDKKKDKNGKEPFKNVQEIAQMESKEMLIGSSSWPWKKNPPKEDLNLPNSCKCLQNRELFKMTGIRVDFEPCKQPIPWCYVRNNANCYDQVAYKSFGAECPDCVLGRENEHGEGYDSNSQIISWSTAACSNEKIAETLKMPYYF